jgi:hypothetical protein
MSYSLKILVFTLERIRQKEEREKGRGEKRRRGEGEMGRGKGDRTKRRRGIHGSASPGSCLPSPVSCLLSPPLPFSPSPPLPFSPSPFLPFLLIYSLLAQRATIDCREASKNCVFGITPSRL